MMSDSDLVARLRQKYSTIPYYCSQCGKALQVTQAANANRPSIYECPEHKMHRSVEVFGEPGDPLVMEMIRRYCNIAHD